MLKHLIFAIFLTTLSIVSVAPATPNNDTRVTSQFYEEVIKPHVPVSPEGLTDNEVKTIRNQVLERTNEYRRNHNLQEFTLNDDLNNSAQHWANIFARLKILKGRPATDLTMTGENIYTSKASTDIGKEAVDTWYNELRFINVGDGDEQLKQNLNGTVHMIHLLWKPYSRMGVSAAKSSSNDYYVVAFYKECGEKFSDMKHNLPDFQQSDINAAKQAHAQSSLASPNNDTTVTSQYYEEAIQPHMPVSPKGLTDDEVKTIRNQVLERTNEYRRNHNIQEFTLNDDLNNSAQDRANILARLIIQEGRPATDLTMTGENIYASKASTDIGKEAVDTWYNELRFINVGDGDEQLKQNRNGTVHMIHLLWKPYSRMGVSAAKSSSDDYYVVAFYNERGEKFPDMKHNLPDFNQSDINAAKQAHAQSSVSLTDDNNDSSYFYDEEVQIHDFIQAAGVTEEEASTIRIQVLDQTNTYREKHGLQELVLNSNITYHTQEWANKLASEKLVRGRSEDDDNFYGENIYKSTSTTNIGIEAVKTWYLELRFVKETDGSKELQDNSNGIGHMIQLLTKSYFRLGVGVAKDDENNVYIVANYNSCGLVYANIRNSLPVFKQSDIDAAKSEHAESTYSGETQEL